MARTKPALAADASRFAPLTEDWIKAQTDSGSYSRGRSYYRQGRIHDAALRNETIEALCDGSDYQPYRVRATLAPAGERTGNLRAFSCSCPRGGFCKHVVAMLLTWINDPDQFAARPPLPDLLAGKSREELVALIERMVQRHPELERLVELPVAPSREAEASPNVATVDEAVIRRQVRSALAGSDRYGYDWGNSWGHAWGAPPELHALLELGEGYVAAGQWANAQVVFSALAEETIEEAEEWMFTADEAGELTGIVISCDQGLADCLAAQTELPESERLPSDARERLMRTIYDIWAFDIFDLGGFDLSRHGVDAVARDATDEERTVVEGWLRGEATDGWHKNAVTGFLADLREAAGASDEEILALYREAELWDDVAAMLLRIDRVDDAVAVAGRHIRIAPRLIDVANALIALGGENVGRAIALVDDLAWEEEGINASHDATLQNWLIAQYSAHGRPKDALKLAAQRFRRQPTLRDYQAVRQAAELPGQPAGTWGELRPELLDHLRVTQAWGVLVDVRLQDGDVAAALDAFDRKTRRGGQGQPAMWQAWSGGYGDQELRLAEAAEADFPDRAIAIYRRKAEAEIERRSRSNYQVAATHLARVKATLERQGRRDEWKAIIAELREGNKRLRALREELDNLDLN